MLVRKILLRALIFLALFFLSSPIQADISLFQSFTQRDGLADDAVTRVAFAADGAAWIATPNGATRAQDQSWVTYTAAHGLGNSWVNAIATHANQIYFATNGGGLSIFDGKTWKTYNLTNSKIPSNYLTAVVIDSHKRVWVGTYGNGVARLDGDVWTKYSLANNYINALALDANDKPWVATSDGAFYFDGKTWTTIKQADGLASNRVNTLAIAPDQRVWFGTDNGATVYDGKTYRTYKKADGLIDNNVTAIAADATRVWIGTARGLAVLEANQWKTYTRADGLADNLISSIAIDANKNVWIGTPHGLSIFGNANLQRATTLPVVLVHGWHSADSDQIDDTEFRYLRQYLQQDGIQVFYAAGISPYKTLFQNAATLRDDIAAVKTKTGASQVDVIAFSMGGLNTRAYLESSYYQNDANGTGSVRRAIILGTPQAGIQQWYALLTREMEDRPTEPSVIELSPEYAALFNRTHAPPVTVPYDLILGDVRAQTGLDIFKNFPPTDGLIDVFSAHALNGPQVRHILNTDAHDWSPSPFPLNITGYLYPAQTYQHFIRNALRDPSSQPVDQIAAPVDPITPRNITPLNVDAISAGQTITRSIVIDPNQAARFFARWDNGDADVKLIAPDGTQYSPATVHDSMTMNAVPSTLKPGSLDSAYLKADIGNLIVYAIPRAATGNWSLVATRLDKDIKPMLLTTYADLDADLKFNAQTDRAWYQPGQPINFQADLSNKQAADVRAKIEWLGDGASPRGNASEIILTPNSSGSFIGSITNLTSGGYYLARVTVRGVNFAREREVLFSVSPQTASLTNNVSARADRSGITVDVGVNVARTGNFALGTTMRDLHGNLIASLTMPITLQPGTQTVSIKIPGREIRARGIDGAYTIDLVLMDASWAAVQLDERVNAITTDAYRAIDFN